MSQRDKYALRFLDIMLSRRAINVYAVVTGLVALLLTFAFIGTKNEFTLVAAIALAVLTARLINKGRR